MNIEMALKSGSYILHLDRIKLSLGIKKNSELFNGEFFFTSFQDQQLFLSKHTHQKAAKFMFGLNLPVALTPAWFLEGQSRGLHTNRKLVSVSVLGASTLTVNRSLCQ